MILNLEDCLEHLAGLRNSPVEFTIEKTDYTIMNSIARQCFKGMALTDRQSALMHEKLQSYRDQFTNLDWDFDYAVNQLRQPLRHIDRSKYIKIVEDWIVIRFPFRKTEIVLVQEAATRAGDGYHHQKGSHQHNFAFNEVNILNLLDRFSTKDFTVDQELLDIYEQVKQIHNQPQKYLSGVSNLELININNKLLPIINDELGELSNETFCQFVDRRFRYGFNYVDKLKETTLADKIALRKDSSYQSKPSEESTSGILNALWDLNRFPILVILEEDRAEDQLYEFANHYRDILNPEQQSVLFRLEDKDAGFNQLIKDRKLNNWVDKSTKVVYINKSKLPKILVNNEWKPCATFSFTSTLDRYLDNYVSFNCDLIVYREEHISPFRRHSRYYG
jgi:hypothetical protein